LIKKKGDTMFKSLLNALGFGSLIMDIFIILAVVVAGSLIFYFVWEAISLAINKNNKKKETDDIDFDVVDEKGMQTFDLERQKYLADTKQESVEVPAEPVEEEAVSEEKEEEEQPQVFNEEALEDVDDDQAEAEKQEIEAEASREERENAERRAYLEERRQELLRRLQEDDEEEAEEENDEPTAEPEQDEDDGDDGRMHREEESEEEPEEESEEAFDEEEEVEEEPEVDALQEERDALAAEKAKYEAMVHELENARKALAESQAAAAVTPAPQTQTQTNNAAAIEELKEKLANAEERLAETEKEFKQCKKEYIPLKKVWETHEKDEKKLRRKEALVAKQKVLLYGVNNYADIDEEKAKKLAEDLDLLDGLKLSVQHCEEVMKNNEERYPLLEKMYNVLKFRDDEIRKDIEFYKAEIERLENEE